MGKERTRRPPGAGNRPPTRLMPRLLVHVEGQTEETFINEVLRPHLGSCGYFEVRPSMVGDPRRREGGITSWRKARKEILIHLREDSGCFVTTMVDYYGLPQTGRRAWPGRPNASCLSFPQNAQAVEAALLADVCQHMGGKLQSWALRSLCRDARVRSHALQPLPAVRPAGSDDQIWPHTSSVSGTRSIARRRSTIRR